LATLSSGHLFRCGMGAHIADLFAAN